MTQGASTARSSFALRASEDESRLALSEGDLGARVEGPYFGGSGSVPPSSRTMRSSPVSSQ